MIGTLPGSAAMREAMAPPGQARESRSRGPIRLPGWPVEIEAAAVRP